MRTTSIDHADPLFRETEYQDMLKDKRQNFEEGAVRCRRSTEIRRRGPRPRNIRKRTSPARR
ncbi:MAG: DUF3364 domain-containing protein [Rhodopseudomonas palustris]|nr:DUF3364 domain-containing protein [Rhodopseudomonas palustris]